MPKIPKQERFSSGTSDKRERVIVKCDDMLARIRPYEEWVKYFTVWKGRAPDEKEKALVKNIKKHLILLREEAIQSLKNNQPLSEWPYV